MEQHKSGVDDVFGIVRDIPLNYVPRESVDQALVDSLSRTKHIVIHGGSKQGKTCLRKYWLNDDDYIIVQCSNKWSVEGVNANILKRAGYEVTQSSETTATGRHKLIARIKAGIPGVSAEGGAQSEREQTEKVAQSPLQLDPEDVNDIIGALKAIDFQKLIVLEDFHYLPPETQRDVAVELKAFHESSNFSVIVVGVWLEENRLIVYNGDLTGRVVAIDADEWSRDELLEVICKGEELLNIKMPEAFKEDLLENALESVAIVQECCRRAVRENGIYQTQDSTQEIVFDR